MTTVASPENTPPDSKGGRNIFQDPAIEEAARNDPFARFVLKNGVSILVSLGAIAFVILAYNRFTTTQEHKRAELTQSVRDIQDSYSQLVERREEVAKLQFDTKPAPDATGKVQEINREMEMIKERTNLKIDALEKSGSFVAVAQLYRGLIAAQFADFEKVNATLMSTEWEQAGAVGSSERFTAELAAYALAKSLLDSKAHIAAARAALVSLAERGGLVAPQAVQALGASAKNDEERAQIKALAESVAKRLPSQQKFVMNLYDE